MKPERTTGWWVVSLLLTSALLLLSYIMPAQIPAIMNPDPAYWYNQYQSEVSRSQAISVEADGAINGLTDSLASANATITQQNVTIRAVTKQRDDESGRADANAAKLLVCEGDKPRTWVGRKIRSVGKGVVDTLAGIGVITVIVTTVKVLL